MRIPFLAVPCLVAGLFATSTHAVVNPFTETFSGPTANWSTASVLTPPTYIPSGGPDGSSFARGSFVFTNSVNGDFPILFRGQDNFSSSSNSFVGNWLASGVTTFSFSVRHNAPSSLDFFARFSNGGPGVVSLQPTLVPAGVWTTFNVPINSSTPFIFEGGPSLYTSTFSALTRVQIGFVVDAAIAGQAGPYTFDVDNVSITPAPGVATALLGAAGLVATRRRRTR